MANAFDSYMRAKQGAMQEGQNMLVMEQAAKKMQRDQKMRDILSGVSNSFDPNTLPPTAAGGEVQPPQGFSMDEAMNQMRAQGLGPEAMVYGKSERDIRLKHKLKQELMQDTLSRMGINADGGMGGGLKSGQTMKMGPRGLEFTFDPSKGAKTKLDREQFEYETGGVQPSGIPSGEQNALSSLPPKMRQEIEAKRRGAIASAEGKSMGEAKTSLANMKANLPRLNVVVQQLSDLGKNATYTYAGQGADWLAKQTGFGSTEGGIARKEYISKVDNEILPLLRETFGAAFTAKEGDSLKATLGDPDATPEEKDAVLRSFIDSKNAQIETKMRRVGETPKKIGRFTIKVK